MAEESNIQTFLRVRPSKNPSGYFAIDELSPDQLKFTLPGNYKSEYINNTKKVHGFHFNGIIDMKATQEEVFKRVGHAAVQNAIDGYNSTIFAYGQTGSGKTFTLTGGPEKYSDRGLIPRSISKIFNEFRTRSDLQLKAYISYLELYNEQGYDLLDSAHDTKSLEDLPKVTMLEDNYGNYHLKNLSMHPADTEEEALNLLFMGDTNRAIAETPMNMASSRSHCIFTIAMELREVGSDKVRRSKLHLVDLAGSERVAKTNSSGSVLNEAKYINSSLFFLEMVIVALYEKATMDRKHIPYRNSMMTSVLRDSLGGNCKTIMVATINPEASHTEESLSTCRFAQRVSMIKNKATVNEDLDPSVIIKRLKGEVLTLREEIAYLKGEAGEGDSLTPQQVEDLKGQVKTYCDDADPRSLLNIGTLSLTKLQETFKLFKFFYSEARANGGGKMIGNGGTPTAEAEELAKQVKDLQGCLLQRDNEIAILVNMVKKGKTANDVMSATASAAGGARSGNDAGRGGSDNSHYSSEYNSKLAAAEGRPGSTSMKGKKMAPDSPLGFSAPGSAASTSMPEPAAPVAVPIAKEEKMIQRHLFGIAPPEDRSLLEEPGPAFTYFQSKSQLSSNIDENKRLLKEKYEEAKLMGERANRSRDAINFLKTSIESLRREKAIDGLRGGGKEDDDAEGEVDQEEESHRRAIEQEKMVYKDSFERLRVLKPEIEHIRKLLEKCRGKLQVEFDQWYNNVTSREDMFYGTDGGNKHTSSYVGGAVAAPSGGRQQQHPPPQQQRQPDHSSGNRNNVSTMSSNSNSSTSGEVNEDIQAFYMAKEQLLKRRGEEEMKRKMQA